MNYQVYLEFVNGKSRGSITQVTSKSEVIDTVKSLHKDSEVWSLASNLCISLNGGEPHRIPTSKSLRATLSAINKIIRDVGRPAQIKDGMPVTVYIPEALKPVLRELGNGSVSRGVLECLKGCGKEEVLKELI